MKKMSDILSDFKTLSTESQEQILNKLRQEFEGKDSVLAVVSNELSIKSLAKSCPYCGSNSINKRGVNKIGVQNYQCKSEDCKKWFCNTTGTSIHWIKKKNLWQDYLKLMQSRTSIKKAAKELGISIQTSFNWRHKILSSLTSMLPSKLGEIVECDELELPISEKGNRNLTRPARKRSSDFKRNTKDKKVTTVQVVTAVSRDGKKYMKAVETKRLSARQIKKAIGSRLSKGSVLITDEHHSYKGFAATKTGITHKTVLAKEHVKKSDKTVHLQTVNSAHNQLRKFLDPFHGVSTKYLQNYLNWHICEKEIQKATSQLKQWFGAILTTDIAYETYIMFTQNAVNIRT
jgi:transposase-like protein